MLVVDASVLVTALGDDGIDGKRARDRLSREDLIAPDLIDLEVLSAWRRLLRDPVRASQAIAALKDLRLTRVAHLPLLRRCWELKDTLTPYDAAYVALAEELNLPFLTADTAIGRVPDLKCEVELLTSASA